MTLRPTFCGLSVQDWKASLGWGRNQFSTLRVSLVRDPKNGDAPAPPAFGSPVYFNFFDFRFNGLLHGWWERRSKDGDPVWEALVQDPRELLDGLQIIVNGYDGSVGPVRNLINAFGWWENRSGFGSARANDSGMPWSLVRTAVQSICDTPAFTPYGGPVTFAGYSYSLDLSELPVPDAAYRVGGGATALGLLDIIDSLCEDGGRDYFVELQGFKIKVRTVSRLDEPPLGTIASYVFDNAKAVTRSEDGFEVRNEVTSSFLTGGEVCTLQKSDRSSAASFWGYDVAGNPVTGVTSRLDLTVPAFTATLKNQLGPGDLVADFDAFFGPTAWPNTPVFVVMGDEVIKLARQAPLGGPNRYVVERGQFGTAPSVHPAGSTAVLDLLSLSCETMNLNASPVADIVGSLSYPCSTLEMRLAKVNFESWSQYVRAHRPDVARLVFSPFEGEPGFFALAGAKPNVVNDNRVNAVLMGVNALSTSFMIRAHRLYEFVKGYADNFYGRKYLVGVPLVLASTDPETLKASYTQEPTEGGWLPEDAPPLGLSPLNQDVFKTQDGRFRPFVVFGNIVGMDLSSIRPDESAIQDNGLYVKAQAERNLVFLPGGQPAVLLSLSSPVFQEAVDAWGGRSLVAAAVLGMMPDKAQPVLNNEAGHFGGKVWPEAVLPDAFAVALKSNVLTYGPWFVAGRPGKVRFESDPSLTPWNYGGWAPMQAAGTARVVNSVTNMQVSEAGLVEQVGPPAVSLGDALQSGGPNVTNIDVSYGPQGITTSYRFATYAPRFGVFSKTLADRLRRAGSTAQEVRKAVRAAANQQLDTLDTVGQAVRGFLANAPRAVKMQSPHEVFVCHSLAEPDASGNVAGWRTFPMAMTFEESVALAYPDDPASYQRTAVMSLDGLLRPFTTAPHGSGMPGMTAPSVGGGAMNSSSLNPFKGGNAMAYLAWGDDYQGLHAYARGADPLTTRALALRGPLMVCGWGYDLQGHPVPGDGSGNWRGDTLGRCDLWKAGPADALWDDRRGVWTWHGNRMGYVSGVIPAGGSGVMTPRTAGGQNLVVWNPWSVTVSGAPLLVAAAYFADENRWNLTAADCLP